MRRRQKNWSKGVSEGTPRDISGMLAESADGSRRLEELSNELGTDLDAPHVKGTNISDEEWYRMHPRRKSARKSAR